MGHTKCVQNVMLVSQNAQFGSKWGLSIRTIGRMPVLTDHAGQIRADRTNVIPKRPFGY